MTSRINSCGIVLVILAVSHFATADIEARDDIADIGRRVQALFDEQSMSSVNLATVDKSLLLSEFGRKCIFDVMAASVMLPTTWMEWPPADEMNITISFEARGAYGIKLDGIQMTWTPYKY